MTVNKINWLINIGNNPLSSQTIEIPFRSKGDNDMLQAESELEEYMNKHYPHQSYTIMYWDWIDPDNKWVECKTCGTWYGSVWDKKGGCPNCQHDKAREERRQQEKEWALQAKEEERVRNFRWWNIRKRLLNG